MDYLETMLVYTLGNILLPGTSKRRLTFGNTTVVSWKEEVKYNEVVMSSWSTFQRKREKYQKKKKKFRYRHTLPSLIIPRDSFSLLWQHVFA